MNKKLKLSIMNKKRFNIKFKFSGFRILEFEIKKKLFFIISEIKLSYIEKYII